MMAVAGFPEIEWLYDEALVDESFYNECTSFIDVNDIHYGPISKEIAEQLCKECGEYLVRNGSSGNGLKLTVRRTWNECVHFTIYKEKHPHLPNNHIYFLDDRTRQLMFMKLSDLIEHIVTEGDLPAEQVMLLKPCSKKSNMILNSFKISKGRVVNPNPYSSKTYFSGQYGSGKIVLVEKKNQRNVIAESRLRSHFRHPNVVFIVGVCILDTLCLVLPGEAQNLLQDYVKKLKDSRTKQMAKLCSDVCYGMSYLHSINVLHRALQSRACIVDKEGVVKISDFDKSVFEESDLAEPSVTSNPSVFVPTRWTAPEVLRDGTFSKSSDIWSFGVLVWEVFNKGQMPYHHLSNEQLMTKLNPGFRLSLKRKHSKYDIILERCLRYSSGNRPTFDSLETVIHSLLL